jgi:TRAP-type C4-dicarboxylate transport system substrate-binding protein
MRTRNAVFANTRALQALDAPSREALFTAAAAATVRGKELAKQAEVVQSDRLREKGMLLPAPSEQIMAELKTIGETLTAEWVQRAGPEGVQMLEKYRAAMP